VKIFKVYRSGTSFMFVLINIRDETNSTSSDDGKYKQMK